MKKSTLMGSIAIVGIAIALFTISNRNVGAQTDPGNNWPAYGYGPMRGAWGDPELRQQMFDALYDNDYNKWKDARDKLGMNGGMMGAINEQNFSKFSEAHRLMREGKFQEARIKMQELGLGFGGGCPMMGGGGGAGFGPGMMRGYNYNNQTNQDAVNTGWGMMRGGGMRGNWL